MISGCQDLLDMFYLVDLPCHLMLPAISSHLGTETLKYN